MDDNRHYLFYSKYHVNSEAIQGVFNLRDPRIVAGNVCAWAGDEIVVETEYLHDYKELSTDWWRYYSWDEITWWLETLYDDMAAEGYVLNDLHCENVMFHPETLDLKVIDPEQFVNYTKKHYFLGKCYMFWCQEKVWIDYEKSDIRYSHRYRPRQT